MTYESLRYAVDTESHIATVTLDRPKRNNALDNTAKKELAAVFRQADEDPGVRVIVLAANGRTFSVGQDTEELHATAGKEYGQVLRETYNPVIAAMRHAKKPIIAAINGLAAGSGLGLALACDLRIMSDTASLMATFVKAAVIPDCATLYHLARLAGPGHAFRIATMSDLVNAQQALELRLVERVVPKAELDEAVKAWALKLAQGPTSIFGMIKKMLDEEVQLGIDAALEVEVKMQSLVPATQDHQEAIKAFGEKRTPQFPGR